VLDRLNDAGMVPDWIDFYDNAVGAGWHRERVVHRLAEAIGDIYGPAYREGWELKFASILDARTGDSNVDHGASLSSSSDVKKP